MSKRAKYHYTNTNSTIFRRFSSIFTSFHWFGKIFASDPLAHQFSIVIFPSNWLSSVVIILIIIRPHTPPNDGFRGVHQVDVCYSTVHHDRLKFNDPWNLICSKWAVHKLCHAFRGKGGGGGSFVERNDPYKNGEVSYKKLDIGGRGGWKRTIFQWRNLWTLTWIKMR